MSNNDFSNIHMNVLTIYNLPEYAQSHPIFNAGYISGIPVDMDIKFTVSVGDVLVYDGSKFVTGRGAATGHTGVTGPIGPTGAPGYSTNTGATGYTGYTGPPGKVGPSGLSTNTGATGMTGYTGYTGPLGPQGHTGPAGSFGGASFDYIFNDSTIVDDPGNGKLSLNNGNVSMVTNMSISSTDDDNSNITSFLNTISSVTNTIKGFYKITETNNINNFAFYSINTLTSSVSWWDISSTYLNSTISPMSFFDLDSVTISFVTNGNQGPAGTNGSTGYTGYTGYTGPMGPTGSVKVIGPPGAVQLYLSSGTLTGSPNFKYIDNQVNGPSGTFALPGYTFINDTDTGMYWNNTNEIGFTTGGTKVLRIAESGIFQNPEISSNNYGVDRGSTNLTSGKDLTISTGGAGVGSSDLDGGDIIIQPGISTGIGRSYVRTKVSTTNISGPTESTIVSREVLFPSLSISGSSTIYKIATITYIQGFSGSISFTLQVYASSYNTSDTNTITCTFYPQQLKNSSDSFLTTVDTPAQINKILNGTGTIGNPNVVVSVVNIGLIGNILVDFKTMGVNGYGSVSIKDIIYTQCSVTFP